MKKPSILKGIAAAGSIYVIFGLNSVFCKDIIQGEVISPPLLFTFRTGIAAILFWTASLFSQKQQIEASDRLRIVAAALLGIIIPQYASLFGLLWATPFDASLMSTLKPVITFVIACLMGREMFNIKSTAGILLALTGIILLTTDVNSSNPVFQTKWQGTSLLLLNGLSFSLYLILFKNLATKYNTITYMKWMLLIAGIVSLAFSIKDMSSISFMTMSPRMLGELGFVIFFATFLCYILMPVGQRNLSATQYSIMSWLQCIVASSVGVAMGLDQITLQKLFAMVLFISGIIIVKKVRNA